jgi:hypothetical protein
MKPWVLFASVNRAAMLEFFRRRHGAGISMIQVTGDTRRAACGLELGYVHQAQGVLA